MGRKIIRISFVLLILIFAFCKNLPAGKVCIGSPAKPIKDRIVEK